MKKDRIISSNPRNSCGKGKRGCSVTIILPYASKKKGVKCETIKFNN